MSGDVRADAATLTFYFFMHTKIRKCCALAQSLFWIWITYKKDKFVLSCVLVFG